MSFLKKLLNPVAQTKKHLNRVRAVIKNPTDIVGHAKGAIRGELGKDMKKPVKPMPKPKPAVEKLDDTAAAYDREMAELNKREYRNR